MNARQRAKFEERFGPDCDEAFAPRWSYGREGYSAACQDEAEAVKGLVEALEELVALVRGESPQLLNEDSGGDSRLSMNIDAALKAWKGEQ